MRIEAPTPDACLALAVIVRRLTAAEYTRLGSAPIGLALEARDALAEHNRDARVLHGLEGALVRLAEGESWVDLPVSPTALKLAVDVERLRLVEELKTDLTAGLPERRRLAAVRTASGLDKLGNTDTHSRRAA